MDQKNKPIKTLKNDFKGQLFLGKNWDNMTEISYIDQIAEYALHAYTVFNTDNGIWKHIVYDKSRQFKAILGVENKHIIVSFRGTANVETFINTNIFHSELCSFQLNPNGPMFNIHKGFMDASNELKNQSLFSLIDNLVAKNNISPDNVIFCGHSLGGALALLIGLLYMFHKISTNESYVPLIITFGRPCVGDEIFVKYYEKFVNIHDVISCDDIVPYLPPDFMGYYQPRTVILKEQSYSTTTICNQENDTLLSKFKTQLACDFKSHYEYFKSPYNVRNSFPTDNTISTRLSFFNKQKILYKLVNKSLIKYIKQIF
jgi:hypothetical protein